LQVTILLLSTTLTFASNTTDNNSDRHLTDSGVGGWQQGTERREQQQANEEYQRQLKEYLKKFRDEQKAISDRFEETYSGLLLEVEKENKKNYVDKVQNIASTVAEETAKHQKLYKKFDRLRSKLRNDWMFPSL
jgi:type II secretory pathway pseudopilin PulG